MTSIMSEEQFTVYDAETQQPLTVTVSGTGEDGQAVQGISYITQDPGQVTQIQQASSDMVQVCLAVQLPCICLSGLIECLLGLK